MYQFLQLSGSLYGYVQKQKAQKGVKRSNSLHPPQGSHKGVKRSNTLLPPSTSNRGVKRSNTSLPPVPPRVSVRQPVEIQDTLEEE